MLWYFGVLRFWDFRIWGDAFGCSGTMGFLDFGILG